MRARAGRRTRSVRARTGRKASSLDPCRESDFLSTIFLILIAQTTFGPIAGPETLPFPETSKKRPCCLCSRSAGARSIQGPCQRLVARNWPGSIGYAGAVPTRSTRQVANRIRAPSPSCVRGAGIGVRPRASSAPAGVVVAGLRARAPWVHTDFRSGGSGGVTGHGPGIIAAS